MSQRDYSSLAGEGEGTLVTVMLGVAAAFLLIGVIVVEYYLQSHYGVHIWSFGTP